ncbi:MAG: T9SS type A sorting domain-containing protein [Bacteroidales bacterium]|nr:T9SS type A sorting domain-containing protein [Bacteroidales bacterium]
MKDFTTRLTVYMAILLIFPQASFSQEVKVSGAEKSRMHHEVPDQEYLAPQSATPKTSPSPQVRGAGFFTKQVNVDINGDNIIGDAANEPSIAVDPVNPDKMVIGWRQFDNVGSNFRQAGYGYSSDGGQTWTFPGVIDPMVFRSDPVLGFDADGKFYYNSLTNITGFYTCTVYKSINGGAGWDQGTDARGGDKQWMAIDRTSGQGNGNIYSCWNASFSSCLPGFFTRSANGGASYEDCIEVDGYPYWGTMAVGPSGELYISGAGSFDGATVIKSNNVQIPGSTIGWDYVTQVGLDGYIVGQDPINPVGILGQVNVGVDHSNGPGHGNVYVLASVARISSADPADVMFARSTDGGATFDPPKRINTDVSTLNYQWFGTMSVAPNGRIDVIWLDTRDDFPGSFMSALYYCYSEDQGETWSINKRLSDSFDPTVGYPQQAKMGDYFDMVSDNDGAHLAWANTLNGEQDVYYTHIISTIVGMNENQENNELFSLTASPNPFRDHAEIRYKLPNSGNVKMVICDLYGVVKRTLVDKDQPAGARSVTFYDKSLPPGFYICRLSFGSHTNTTRLIKLK